MDGICLAAGVGRFLPIPGVNTVAGSVSALCGFRGTYKAFAGAGAGSGAGTGSGTGTGGSHTTLLPTQGSTSRTCPNTLFSSRNNAGSGAQTGQSGGQVGSQPGRVINPPRSATSFSKETHSHKGEYRTNGKSGKDKEYYNWDYIHNDIEVYNHKGKHLGSKDPVTGEMYKPADPRKTVPKSML